MGDLGLNGTVPHPRRGDTPLVGQRTPTEFLELHRMTILQAIPDPQLFAPHFRDRATWAGWLAFLAALFALPMDARARARFSSCTGRTCVPSEPAREGWVIVGRRGGKSLIAALVAVFLACFRDYSCRPSTAVGSSSSIILGSSPSSARSTIVPPGGSGESGP